METICEKRLPFVAQVAGDLTFAGGNLLGQTRTIQVACFEPRDLATRLPNLVCDLPFVAIEEAGVTATPVDEVMVYRKRSYRVSLRDAPPDGTSIGTLTIHQPLDESSTFCIGVLVKPNAALEAFPRAVVLTDRAGDSASLVVVSDVPTGNLLVDFEGGVPRIGGSSRRNLRKRPHGSTSSGSARGTAAPGDDGPRP